MAAPLTCARLLSRRNSVVVSNVATLLTMILTCVTLYKVVGSMWSIANIFIVVKVFITQVILTHVCLRVFYGNLSKNFPRVGLLCVPSVPVFHMVSILFGASVTEYVSETLLFSCLLTAVVVFPTLLSLGTDTDTLARVFLYNSVYTETEVSTQTTAWFSIIGAWLGAFPIPLDWDRPWQVWPITCVVGTLSGYAVGLVVASVRVLYMRGVFRRKAVL